MDRNVNKMRNIGGKSDPFLAAKKRARHRFVGVSLFSLILFLLADIFFSLPPKHLPSDFVVESPEGSRSSRELAAEYQRLNKKFGKTIRDEDIKTLKKLKRSVWYVEAGMFRTRKKANLLNERLILEGYSPNLKKRLIEDKPIFVVVLGPYDFVKAEEIVNKMVSKGLKADINRF